MTPDLFTSMRELHSRISDGLHIRLLWCQSDGRVFVASASSMYERISATYMRPSPSKAIATGSRIAGSVSTGSSR